MEAIGPDVEARLVEAALAARHHAYAPYSNFHVGAALLCADGVVVTGCNVENASYGLCVCAERNAIGAAIAQGRRAFIAIAVATTSVPPSSPCGMCRQVLSELAAGIPVLLVNEKKDIVRTSVDALLPGAFSPTQLQSGRRGEGG